MTPLALEALEQALSQAIPQAPSQASASPACGGVSGHKALPGAAGAVLVTVQQVQGSAPREVGAWMAVFTDRLINTLGGGHLEFSAIAVARQWLAGTLAGGADAFSTGATPPAGDAPSDGSPFTRRFALGPSLGQCCGGVVELRFEWLQGPLQEELRDRLRPRGAPAALFGGGHVGRALVRILAIASGNGRPSTSRWMSRIAATLSGAEAQIRAANSRAMTISWLAGAVALMRPRSRHSDAVSTLPANITSLARAVGIRRGSRTEPASGNTPTFDSGREKVAWSAATMRSAAIAISNPPPTAMPFTAAMIGFERFGNSGKPPNPPTP